MLSESQYRQAAAEHREAGCQRCEAHPGDCLVNSWLLAQAAEAALAPADEDEDE